VKNFAIFFSNVVNLLEEVDFVCGNGFQNRATVITTAFMFQRLKKTAEWRFGFIFCCYEVETFCGATNLFVERNTKDLFILITIMLSQ